MRFDMKTSATTGNVSFRNTLFLVTTAALSLAAWGAEARAGGPAKLAVLPAQVAGDGVEVPELFDDYLLTAVQNIGSYTVIGLDDINAMIGFEQQKALVGCEEMSCLADIGGALGVEMILVVKIARLGNDWVVTSKLINIRSATVTSRSSDFVSGDVKALLKAVPGVVTKLFAGGGLATSTTPTGSTGSGSGTTSTKPPTVETSAYDPSVGAGTRKLGVGLAIAGYALTGAATVLAIASGSRMADEGEVVWEDGSYQWVVRDGQCVEEQVGVLPGTSYSMSLSEDDCMVPDDGVLLASALGIGLGLGLAGYGAGAYVDGIAQAHTGNTEAEGHSNGMWLGWLFAVMAASGPVAGMLLESDVVGYLLGITGVGGAAWVFIAAMGQGGDYASTPGRSYIPMVAVAPTFRDGGTGGRLVLRWTF